ncbi:MAG: hypothetical protein COV72_06655 [Candidatus Omnitrophica bacterium CG11_big_fil_rev_8_21_14_0_20_42_13]|uniref:Uncharacterized protein n=1 Tax=Candidatus Ghiorseimicrobium undicola TaxID=1974746 RepID=A0A2H0LWJ8_9BACT|nr:MAG: hypothetical protein COV72_06655 [Candidatus Omnitrophica bacterium CG11_big_fil_rev_8_21_14_0_20_42_13]
MLPVLKKEKSRFILRLNTGLYKENIIRKAVAEDRAWIKIRPVSKGCCCLEMKTGRIDDVLKWVNYLIYLHKG